MLQTELEKMRISGQKNDQSLSILTTMCYGLRDSNGRNLSNIFWSTLNESLKHHLRVSREERAALPAKKEQLEVIKDAIQANNNLDDSLLDLLK